jgi:hypothetical protein
MRETYSEKLPMTLRFKTANLESARDPAWKAAQSIGVIDLLQSKQLHLYAEAMTGLKLESDPGIQVICYDRGDFTGPHNDHQPELKHMRDGYIDVHINLPEPSALSQLLIYEAQSGLLNGVMELGRGAAILIYHLPFWHYVTPLVQKRKTRSARRWVLLATYIIKKRRSIAR